MKRILLVSLLLSCIYVSFAMAGSFEKSGEYYRYFEDDGSVAYDKIIEWDRKWYYVNNEGYAVFNSWVEKDGRFHYAGNDGYFYTDGAYRIGDNMFYFDTLGEMQKGWCCNDLYYGDDDDGCLLSGFQELDVPKTWATEANDKTAWFYFDNATCKRVFADSDAYITKTVGSKEYCFDQNGIIRTGWRLMKDTNPVMKGYRFFNPEVTEELKYGEMIVNSWYATEPPTDVIPNGEVRYFYFTGNGQPRCSQEGKYQKIRLNDKTFLFNEYGYAVYGLRQIDNKFYYFGPNLADCSMKTGIINEDLDGSGDTTTYYFMDDGQGFSGVYKNKLYYKGKLQQADAEQKYAAFSVNSITRLVNTAGVVMYNKKKVKDGDGYAWSTSSTGVVTYRDEDAENTELRVPTESDDK